MANIHPSMIIRVNVDAREYSETLRTEIRRSYAYVSTAVVQPTEISSPEIQNTMQLDVKVRQPYWDENDAQQQSTWESGMEKWLRNMFVKLSSTVQGANATYREHGKNPLYYAWTEVKFGEHALITFKTPLDCSLSAAHVETIEAVRHLLCSGAFGSDVARVCIPSLRSYDQQKQALVAADEAQKHAQQTLDQLQQSGEEAPQDILDAAQSRVPGEVVRLQSDAAMLRESEQTKSQGDSMADDSLTPTSGEEDGENAQQAPTEAAIHTYLNFDPDMRIWGIEYVDGAVREYDSKEKTFIE